MDKWKRIYTVWYFHKFQRQACFMKQTGKGQDWCLFNPSNWNSSSGNDYFHRFALCSDQKQQRSATILGMRGLGKIGGHGKDWTLGVAVVWDSTRFCFTCQEKQGSFYTSFHVCSHKEIKPFLVLLWWFVMYMNMFICGVLYICLYDIWCLMSCNWKTPEHHSASL